MTWLFSLYWFGALAVAGPIAFHLWRRMPRSERTYSTLMFLTPSPPRVTSRSRIEHWILLLVRASALILLAFAFTRPLWRNSITEPDRGDNEQRLVLLVDTSASMRRDGLWDRLIRDLDDRLAVLPLQTTVALYRFDRQFVPVADFREMKEIEPAARREVVRTRLKELKPTWQETRLGEALVQAAIVFQDAQLDVAKSIEQRIWLASDLQSGSDITALQAFEWPDDVHVEIVPVHPSSESNAGLQIVERNVESDDNVLRVRVTNAADSTKEQLILRWDCRDSPEVSVYVPPGQSRILLPPKLPAGIVANSLILRGDDDDFDNHVFVAQPPPETRVVVYCGTDSANDADGARFYLERVFAASQRFQIELRESHEVLSSPSSIQPSLIILVQPELEAQSILHSHLANGGTVVIASPTAESLLASLKLCGRDKLTVTEAAVSKYSMLGDVDFDHPVFAPFSESQFSDFTGIRFWKHRAVQGLTRQEPTADRGQSPVAEETERVLARFDDGDPAIFEYSQQRGRVIVFAAGWQPGDSQFARSSKFPMLMFRLLEYSTGATPRLGSETVGHPIAWPAIPNLKSVDLGSANLPDGTELSLLKVDQPFTQTDQPGIYTLSAGGRTEQIAVNLAADESRTTPLTPEQLESQGLKLTSGEKPHEQERQQARQRQLQLVELEQSQKLWQTLLFVVIGLLLLETYLSDFFRSSFSEQPDRNSERI